MLGIFNAKASNLQVGLDFLPTGVAAVALARGGRNSGQVRHCDFLPAVGADEQSQALRQWVDERGLKNVACNALIAKHDVQIFQIEKPAVVDAELLQAVSWKVKDLVSFDVAAAVVDVFDMPASSKSLHSQINAVVANEAVVGGYVERIRESGLELRVIDIHDLAGKNFSRAYDLSDKTYALLQFGDKDGLLSVYHDGDLYISRDLKLGVLDMQPEAGDESLYDRLLLELQRSMDYFESNYGMGQVQELLIFPQCAGTEKMATYLQNYVSYEIDFVQVELAGNGAEGGLERHCFSAYCAALRGFGE